jgi:KaiC/GvpD/RAD55 family RecA-like ATPase
LTLEPSPPAESRISRIGRPARPAGSEHYHAGMKREHPDWNFCPTCNASLLEPVKAETFSALLSNSDTSFLISITLDDSKKSPVWAEATHLGSKGLAKERLFEETVIQHVIPAFKNGFRLAKYSGSEADLFLFMQILAKYSQRELADQNPSDRVALSQLAANPNNLPPGMSKTVSEAWRPSAFEEHLRSKSSNEGLEPEKKLNVVSSGIAGFDAICGGGLPKNRITLLSGPSGLGKSIFAVQFLLDGVKRNEKGVLALTDESPQDILEEMESLGLPLLKAIQERKVILAVRDSKREYRIKGIEVTNCKTTSDLLSALAKIRNKQGIRRLVIDSLTGLVSGTEAHKVGKELETIVDDIEKLQCTTVATGVVPSTNPRGQTYFGIEERLVSGLVIFKSASVGGKLLRYLYVAKMKGFDHRLHKYVFSIEQQLGVRILEPLAEHIQQAQPPQIQRGESTLEILSALRAFTSVYLPLLNQNNSQNNIASSSESGLRFPNKTMTEEQTSGLAEVPLNRPSHGDEKSQPSAKKLLSGSAVITNKQKRVEIKPGQLPSAAKENPWSQIISDRSDSSDTEPEEGKFVQETTPEGDESEK